MIGLGYKTMCLCAIAALSLFSAPAMAIGPNLNLTGSLNINDMQVTSTSNLLLSMLVTLAESIIPIVVGAAVGHKSLAFWQEKKDRISAKNSILSNYAQGFKVHNALLDNFANHVFKSYTVFQKDSSSQPVSLNDYNSPADNVISFVKFPTDTGEFPSRKFQDEYRDLESKIGDASYARERLYLDLKIFSKGRNDMTEKLQNIRSMLKKSELVLNRFLHSTEANDFIAFYNAYLSSSKKIKDEAERFEIDISKIKLS